MEVFLKSLLNMSFMASIVILAVIVVRWLFAWLGVPKKYAYLLWILPFIRLVCPWSIESEFSLLPDTNQVVESIAGGWQMLTEGKELGGINEDNGLGASILPDISKKAIEGINAGSADEYLENGTNVDKVLSQLENVNENEVLNQTQNFKENEEEDQLTDMTADGAERQSISSLWWGLGGLWLAGVLGIVFYSIVTYKKLKEKLVISFLVRDNIYLADGIDTAFVTGYFRPLIYLPSGISEQDMEYVIAHEKVHIARWDHWIKTLAFFTVTLHWFNPVCWAAFVLLGKDMEFSCDEAVIAGMETEDRKGYANVLLNMATGKMQFVGMSLTFAEGDPQNRIKNIMQYKKPVAAASVLAVLAAAALAVFFLTNPGAEGEQDNTKQDKTTQSIDGQASDADKDTEEIGEIENKLDKELSAMENAAKEALEAEDPEDLPYGEVQIKAPIVDAASICGVYDVELIYASPSYAVGWCHSGLFVYSVEAGRLTGAVNVKAIGCDMTKGDNYTDVFVADEGGKVYMHPMKKDYMFVYDIDANTLEKQRFTAGADGRPQGLKVVDNRQDMLQIMDGQVPDIWISDYCQVFKVNEGEPDERKYLAYLASGSGIMTNLSYCFVEWDEAENGWSSRDGAIWCPYKEEWYPFFEGDAKNYLWEFTEDSQMCFAKTAGVSDKGLTLGIYNSADQEISYGEEYCLYRYANDGTWKELEHIQDIGFHDIEYTVKPGGVVTVPIDWSRVYGTLPTNDGQIKYRLVKKILVPEDLKAGESDADEGSSLSPKYKEVELGVEFTFPAEE